MVFQAVYAARWLKLPCPDNLPHAPKLSPNVELADLPSRPEVDNLRLEVG